MHRILSILIAAFAALPATASPRTSAHYSIATEAIDTGGSRATSVHYASRGSAGGVTGLSTSAAPAEIAKAGYLAQLYEVTGLALNSATPGVNETETVQLGAWQTLDDATFLALDANSVNWTVASGPLAGISESGLATAGAVFQDTNATVHAGYGGFTATLQLTVRDTLPDNFGSYAGDGLDDAWQVQYFGQNNPNAAPGADPDGDGQTNLFEFTAGLIPTDPQSRFAFTIAPVSGQPAQHAVVFTPLVAGRSYLVQYKFSLTDPTWQTLTGATQSDTGATRTVTDTTAAAAKFYRVQVTRP